MVKQSYVKYNDIADFINNIGEDNIIAIVPLEFESKYDGISSRYHPTESGAGYAFVTKYLIIYNYGRN